MAHEFTGDLTAQDVFFEPKDVGVEVLPARRYLLVITRVTDHLWRRLHALPVDLKACFGNDVRKVQVCHLAQQQERFLRAAQRSASKHACCLSVHHSVMNPHLHISPKGYCTLFLAPATPALARKLRHAHKQATSDAHSVSSIRHQSICSRHRWRSLKNSLSWHWN